MLGRKLVFYQDSDPNHKAKVTPERLMNVP